MERTDDLVLRVKSTTPVPDLASAVAHGVTDGKHVIMRCIGPQPISQATKAVAVARGYVAPRGIDLALIPGFINVEMPEGTVTGVALRVVVL